MVTGSERDSLELLQSYDTDLPKVKDLDLALNNSVIDQNIEKNLSGYYRTGIKNIFMYQSKIKHL